MGEFLGAVIKAGKGRGEDPRLQTKSTGQSETAADGGYTVTTDLARFITQQASLASVIEQKCSHLEIGANYTGIKIPQLNETTRSATTLYGGVRIYSPAEGVGKTAFIQKYTQKTIDLKKLCAVNYMTDELMQDNTALEGFIRMNVGKAFAWVKDNEIISQTLGSVTSIVNSAATAEVTVAGNSPTAVEWGSIYTANCNRSRAEWFLSTAQYAALLSLTNAGTLVNLFQPNYTVSPAGTLFGRPINVIEQAGGLTDESSVMFLDLTDYLVIGKGGIQEATSIHVKFLEDETAFRWTTRFGGAPLMASTVTLPDTSVVSSFVTRD
jgi:HK97 family phage major capsid protein